MATRLLPSLKYKENVHSTSEQTQEVLFQECLQNKTNPGQVCLHFLFTEDYGYEVWQHLTDLWEGEPPEVCDLFASESVKCVRERIHVWGQKRAQPPT